MNYIELIGVPGVGKSTLYRTLHRYRPRRSPEWTTAREVVSRPAGLSPDAGFAWTRMIRRVAGRPQADVMVRGGVSFIESNPDLTKWLWEMVTRCRVEAGAPPSLRSSPFDAAYDLMWALRRVGVVSTTADPGICVLEEGLIHRVLTGMCPSAQMSEEDIETFIRLLPSPLAVVRLMYPDSKALAIRIERRRGVPEFLRGLTMEDIEAWLVSVQRWEDVVVKQLILDGVPTLNLDASEPLSVQRNRVLQLLQSLHVGRQAAEPDKRVR